MKKETLNKLALTSIIFIAGLLFIYSTISGLTYILEVQNNYYDYKYQAERHTLCQEEKNLLETQLKEQLEYHKELNIYFMVNYSEQYNEAVKEYNFVQEEK